MRGVLGWRLCAAGAAPCRACLSIAPGCACRLPAAFAVYVWLARRALDDKPAVDWKSFDEARDFLDAVPVLLPSFSADAERIEETIGSYLRGQDETGLEGYFRPLISRSLNGALKVALGPVFATRASVINSGARTKSRYQLPADLQIELLDA